MTWPKKRKNFLKSKLLLKFSPHEILKNYRRENTVMLYYGMHMALECNEIYKTKSYAVQSTNAIKKIHITNLDQIYT